MAETALHGREKQMSSDYLLPARSIAMLLASILGPEVYDAPPFNGGNPYRGRALRDVAGPIPDPWLEVALNPQPLPPKWHYAVVLADAHIQEVVRLDQTVANFGEGFAEAGTSKSRLNMSALEEWCPLRPKWPKGWPPPPPPPWEEVMQSDELFMFGMRFLAAADQLELDQLQEAVTRVGERAVGLAMESKVDQPEPTSLGLKAS
jgi:hypothetical protein